MFHLHQTASASLTLLGCRLSAHSLLPRVAQNARSLFSFSGQWKEKFTKDVRIELEQFWKNKVITHPELKNANKRSKFYVLSMFPYPSGKLHMGHVRVYTISDAMARYHRLMGKNVIHPMGWDAFGLPAENAAIERGENPAEWTNSNIGNMKQQMKDLCCDFDWEHEVATCDPHYYKWTQFIFLKMFEAGLVYQKEAPVNWDPVDLTVLADEQIDSNGRSWRSGSVVEKKMLRQWYIRTTAYSKSLLDGLNNVNPDLWRDIISLQQNWIGNCDGVRFDFKLQRVSDGSDIHQSLSLFTKRPEAIFGISHILLSKDNSFNKEQYYDNTSSSKTSEDILLNVVAVNPFSGRTIPLFVQTSHDFGENLDAHAGIPSCEQDDLYFAQKHKLEYIDVLDKDQGIIINSGKFSGLSFQDSSSEVVKTARELNCGGHITSERTRDWLISRQRYWGTPIPVIHCKKHGAVPVPYEDLPVTLPNVIQFRDQGTSPLSSAKDWLKVKCPKCDGYGERETDTMDTFVDSSWYYLRYLDSKNETEPFSRDVAHRLMPVDLYIGGKEHAILHLYYARFFSHFLHDHGLVPTREPFINLLTQGMVMGQSFRVKSTGKYIHPSEVEVKGKSAACRATGEPVEVQWEKMSKSKYNGVDPEVVLSEFGTDSTRLCILSNVAPKTDRPWTNEAFVGILRWQSRIWSLVSDFMKQRSNSAVGDDSCLLSAEKLRQLELDVRDARNHFLLEVSFHMEQTFLLNTAISRLQGLSNALKKVPVAGICNSFEFERALAELVVMLYPFAPMFSSELWTGLQAVANKKTDFDWASEVQFQRWPEVDDDYCLPMSVKVNGKDAFDVRLPMPYTQTERLTTEEAFRLVQEHSGFAETIGRKPLLRHHLNICQHYKADFEISVQDEKPKKKQRTKA